jgi:hypothetical protein
MTRIGRSGHETFTGNRRGAYRVLVRLPKYKRTHGRTRSAWENNIKVNLQGVRWRGTDCIDLAQDREGWWVLLNEVMNLWDYIKCGKFSNS